MVYWIYTLLVEHIHFVPIPWGQTVTQLLAFSPVEGHPDASNIFSAVKRVVGSEGIDLPLSQVVSQTSDGASSMVKRVAARAKSFNSHIFIQHCFNPHFGKRGRATSHT